MFTIVWLAKATIRRVEAIAEKSGIPTAGRLYWNALRELKPKVDLALKADPDNTDLMIAQVRINNWLREFNFSDAMFKAGGKLDNDTEEWDGDGYVLVFDPETNEWGLEETENDKPLPITDPLAFVGPYATEEQNTVFQEAQRGGYPMLGGARVHYDDHDDRKPEGWPEYFSAEGLWEFLGENAKMLAPAVLDCEVDDVAYTWMVESTYAPFGPLWDTAQKAHRDGDINWVSLAMLADRLGIEDLNVQVLNAEGDPVGPLASLVNAFEWELADVEVDLPHEEWGPVSAAEEQGVADSTALKFEYELLLHYKSDPGTYFNYRLKKMMPRQPADAYYDLAYIRAVIAGYSVNDAKWYATIAKARAQRKPTPSRTVVGVTFKGLKLSNRRILRWQQVNDYQLSQLQPRGSEKEKVVAQLREGWKQLPAHREVIAKIGKAMVAA